jgi:hypothetical protein
MRARDRQSQGSRFNFFNRAHLAQLVALGRGLDGDDVGAIFIP